MTTRVFARRCGLMARPATQYALARFEAIEATARSQPIAPGLIASYLNGSRKLSGVRFFGRRRRAPLPRIIEDAATLTHERYRRGRSRTANISDRRSLHALESTSPTCAPLRIRINAPTTGRRRYFTPPHRRVGNNRGATQIRMVIASIFPGRSRCG